MCDKLDLINTEKVTSFIMSLYQENGSFFNDPYGEVDLRIVYCGVCSLVILGQLDKINKEETCSWVSKCQNSDGGMLFYCDGMHRFWERFSKRKPFWNGFLWSFCYRNFEGPTFHQC